MMLYEKVDTKNVSLGQPIFLNIPRSKACRALEFKLKGSVTIAGGATNGTVKDSSTARLLTMVTVRHPQSGAIFQLPAQVIHRINQQIYGARPEITEIASGAVQANTPVSVSFTVPFENVMGIKPFDTLVKGEGLSSFDVMIEVATSLSDFVQGSDRTLTVGTTAFTLDCYAVLESVPGIENIEFGELRYGQAAVQPITGANDALPITGISTGMFYTGFWIYIEDAGVPSNGVLTNITLRNGTEYFANGLDAETLQRANKKLFGLETMPTGWYFLDLMPDGRLNASLDTANRDKLRMELKTAAPGGTCTARIIGVQYYPVEMLAAARAKKAA